MTPIHLDFARRDQRAGIQLRLLARTLEPPPTPFRDLPPDSDAAVAWVMVGLYLVGLVAAIFWL